jgi:hypothetical protein
MKIQDMKVQNEFESTTQAKPASNNEINKALHCMVAHLHRYGSELESLGDALDHVQQQHAELFKMEPTRVNGVPAYLPSKRVTICLAQVNSQVQSAKVLRRELESKVGNFLNLVSSRLLLRYSRFMTNTSA